MADRKYASDYRMEETVSPKGGRGSRRVYVGTYYRFCREKPAIRALGRRLLAAAAAVALLMLPLLWNNTRIGRTFYVILPMAFSLLPLYHVGAVGLRLCRWEAPLTRQQRDLTDKRLGVCVSWLAALLALTLGGALVYWAWKGLLPGEGICVAGLCLGLLVSLALLPLRHGAKTRAAEGGML